MARSIRPRTLAAGFGTYFLVIALSSWYFASGLSQAWYLEDLTRWVYTTYMLVAAIFLVGLGGLAISIRRTFAQQIRDIDTRLRPRGDEGIGDALPPPLPETLGIRDNVDRDIDELLESLSEVEASAVREAEAMETATVQAVMEMPAMAAHDATAVAAKRERLVERQKYLGRFIVGPGLVAGVILGVSGMMLPGSGGFAQYYHQFNTAVILGIGYSWIGVGAYIAATIYALVSAKDARRKRTS